MDFIHLLSFERTAIVQHTFQKARRLDGKSDEFAMQYNYKIVSN